jgi:uncharacterized membrane protein YozB (DUF420 family)
MLLVMVFLGFGRTFFLRSFFEQPARWQFEQLPTVYLVHGVVLTAWFILLVVQSTFINIRKVELHRKLGYGMAVLAVLVVFTGIQVVLDSTPRSIKMGILDSENQSQMLGQSVPLFVDLLSLIVFTLSIGIAIVLRRNIQLHRTLMLIGSMSFMVVALARALPEFFLGVELPLIIGCFLLFPALLFAHDWIYFKRFPVYAFAGLLTLIAMVFMTLLFTRSDWWFSFFMNYLSGLN